MIQGILNYIYTGVAGAAAGAVAAALITATVYGSRIDAINANFDRKVAEEVAEKSRSAVRWVETQRDVIAKLEKALKIQAQESKRKSDDLQKTVSDFRGKLDRGWVFVDPKSAPPSGSTNAGVSGTPGPSGGNPAGVLSGQTSANLLAFATDAELTRISLLDQRNYALQCHKAYSELRVKYNALISGQDKP